MTFVMTPVVLFLLFVSVTAAPRSAIDDGLQTQDFMVQAETATDEIEKTNVDLGDTLEYGDIMPNRQRNADPCVARGCKWRKRRGVVKIPYVISSVYTTAEVKVITDAFDSFASTTCVEFVPRQSEQDYLSFFSGSGCWSYVGRRGNEQQISLRQRGCVSKRTVQHEILHALGFHHEQSRRDRDRHVRILTENIRDGAERNFNKVRTRNLRIGYDFDSVMHYSNFAFSKNGQPTIVAKRDPSRQLGGASEMSANDIARVNKLYRCRNR